MNILHSALNLLFPPVCGICGKLNESYLCDNCHRKLLQQMLKRQPYKKNQQDIFHLVKYEGIIREKLLAYKFKDQSYLSKTFAQLCIKNEKCYAFIKSYDIIIPVPMYGKKKRQRGYNQCELIAKELQKYLPIKLETKVLIKYKNTPAQSTLSKEERKRNIKDVYKVQNISKIENKRVLLLDDIYTTGSTISECSRVLQQAGIKQIGILTIAKD